MRRYLTLQYPICYFSTEFGYRQRIEYQSISFNSFLIDFYGSSLYKHKVPHYLDCLN